MAGTMPTGEGAALASSARPQTKPLWLPSIEGFEAKVASLAATAKAMFTSSYRYKGSQGSPSKLPKILDMRAVEVATALNDKIATFWARYSDFVAAVWLQLSQENRVAVLASRPFLPLSKHDKDRLGQPSAFPLLCPELNIEDLAKPPALVELFNERFAEQVHQDIQDLLAVQSLVTENTFTNLNPEANTICTFLTGKSRGLWYMTEDLAQARAETGTGNVVAQGVIADGHTYELMLVRRLEILQALAHWVDVFIELFGTDPDMASLSTRYCVACGRHDRMTRPLSACAGCGTAVYCSLKCQRRHWPRHKLFCGCATVMEPLPKAADYSVRCAANDP